MSLNRITKEYAKINKSPIPNIHVVHNPNNILEVNFLVYGLKEIEY
jgi:ubiquitin-protein ligase